MIACIHIHDDAHRNRVKVLAQLRDGRYVFTHVDLNRSNAADAVAWAIDGLVEELTGRKVPTPHPWRPAPPLHVPGFGSRI